ncbi:hypothetical protein LCGC14_1716840, partial [marine sediment metagenome]
MVLSDSDDEKWKYSEHTKVKHEVFSKYIKAWSNILGTYHSLNIFDCFAGRGRYIDGSEGSPLKILQILINLKKNQGKPENAYCHFIEKNKDNHDNLCDEITNFKTQNTNLDWLEIKTYCDEFSNILDDIIRDNGDSISTGFFFIDPFGFSGISLELIKKILTYERTEVFITFMTRDVNRFLKSPPHQSSIQELFGCENVQEMLTQEPYFGLKREQAILSLYRNQLHEKTGVKYTFPFQVKADKNLQTVYYLIHCTNNPMGCELMKAIMYKSYGGPSELFLATLPTPSPKPDEVLIKVIAAEASKSDCEMRSFHLPVKWTWLPMRILLGIQKPKRPVLGMYFSGEVLAVGESVKRFNTGDQVFGSSQMKMGAYAEFLCLPETYTLLEKPENMSFEAAAAVPLGGLNALHYLNRAAIKPGEHVLINGAGGSIGTHAVQ